MSKKSTHSFPESITETLRSISDEKIIVACSGGVDSMVLLHLLREQRAKSKEQRGGLIVAHVHHGLRETATRDENIVQNYCERYGLTFEVLKADIKTEAKKTQTTIEECARNIRKSWLEEILVKYSAKYILTAHHAGDQTETILYRLVKGTGITGLMGIQQYSGNYFRPLLGVRKNEIIKYAEDREIPYGHDETNDDTTIPRNLIRHVIIPEIEKINPGASESLARLSNNAGELKQGFDLFFEQYKTGIALDTYHELPIGFQHELLRFWYEQANGSTHGFSEALVDELDRFFSTRNGGEKTIKKMKLAKKRGEIILL